MDYKREIARVLCDDEVSEESLYSLIAVGGVENVDYALPCFKFAGAFKKSPDDVAFMFKERLRDVRPDFILDVTVLKGYLNIKIKRNHFVLNTLKWSNPNNIKNNQNNKNNKNNNNENNENNDINDKSKNSLNNNTNNKNNGINDNLNNGINDKSKNSLNNNVNDNLNNIKNENGKKTVVIDYSSINIAKDFHIGHLMSTAIGGSLHKIFKYLGYNTVGINHIGDYGTQFGKLIVAYKKWGSDKELNMDLLMDLYAKFHVEEESDPNLTQQARDWFKKIELGDSEAQSLFTIFKEITLNEANKIYEKLNIQFDSYNGEAFYNDKMGVVIDKLNEKNLLVESDGAKVVDLSEFNMPPCLILKSDGASLYATRDLSASIYRKNTYNFDQCLYVVAYQQNLHFKQVFKVLELMGYEWSKNCIHVAFGMVSIEGSSLSTRKGNIIKLKDVLNTSTQKTLQIINEKNPQLENKNQIASDIGIGAVIFYVLYNNRIKDVSFSYDKALNFEGETGPYIQYTHARCCSLLKKSANIENLEEIELDEQIDYDVLCDDISYEVIKNLYAFDYAVIEASKQYEPSIIARLLIKLSQSFNRFYFEHRILNEPKNVLNARLSLVKMVKDKLKLGLELILLNAPESM